MDKIGIGGNDDWGIISVPSSLGLVPLCNSSRFIMQSHYCSFHGMLSMDCEELCLTTFLIAVWNEDGMFGSSKVQYLWVV